MSTTFTVRKYSSLTGKPGVCLPTLGPGATNLLTGMATVNMDFNPVSIITRQAGQSQAQETPLNFNVEAVYKPVME